MFYSSNYSEFIQSVNRKEKEVCFNKMDCRCLSAREVVKSLNGCPNLEHLILRQLYGSKGFLSSFFSQIARESPFTKLSIVSCIFGGPDVAGLIDMIRNNHSVKELILTNSDIKIEHLNDLLEALCDNQGINHLGLCNLRFNETHEPLIAKLISKHPTLKTIDLSNTCVTDAKGYIRTAYSTNPRIKSVWVLECDFMSRDIFRSFQELNKERMI